MNLSRTRRPARRTGNLWLALVVAAGALAGCTPSRDAPKTCAPQCAGKTGGDDGCGGVCPNPTTCANCGPGGVCVDGKCVCHPSCDGTHVGPDGCGGTCACADGKVQDANGQCVAPSVCTDTCSGSGNECGSICGKDCGACDGSKSCVAGKCLCVPKCDGTRCDDGCGGVCACAGGNECAADGRCVAPSECHDTCDSAGRTCGTICGGSCGTCGADEGCSAGHCKTLRSCDDCDLQLHVLSAGDGKMTVAIDVAPADPVSRPRVADIRFRASRAVSVAKVTAGDALSAAGKSLFLDPASGQPFRVRADGAVQMLVQSVSGAEVMGGGRVATLDLTYDGATPVTLWLVRRDEVLAPPAADSALQSGPYDTPVTVSR